MELERDQMTPQLKTHGRPQEIMADTVRRGESIGAIFAGWLWEDFNTLLAEREAWQRKEKDIRRLAEEWKWQVEYKGMRTPISFNARETYREAYERLLYILDKPTDETAQNTEEG